MSSQSLNRYKADLRDFSFLLFEQFKLQELLEKEPFEAWAQDDIKMVLSECYKFACEVIGPLNAAGDVGCTIENGSVKTPAGFKEAWQKLYEAGWKNLGVSTEWGGQGAPSSVHVLSEEMLSGANTAFNMYPGLTWGAAELLEVNATPAQKELFLKRMFGGQWGGTMCLTEPQAGSDVGAAKSRAVKREDGKYNITGTKIFISGGDHDLAENIIHLVLARIEGAPAGTKGLSLFIVPKYRVDAEGNIGQPNDVSLGSIEHKMGINGSATCVLNFGENGDCIGELVGGIEHVGMRQMFVMMNGARIAVGIQSVGVAAAAYLNALDYARDRKQGSSINAWKDANAPRVAIIEHPDVRRMLLDMKSRVEGIRALIVKLATHQDLARVLAGKDDAGAAYHQGQVELLTPIVKSYSSDQAFRVSETAIQVLGGAGYIKDYGIEQYARDAKIFSVYEGTNHIQAMDLVGRKLQLQGGAFLQGLIGDLQKFVVANTDNADFGADVKLLSRAQEALMNASFKFMTWFQGGKMPMVPLYANRYLEIMSETVVAWLLLEQGIIASAAQKNLAADHPDFAFYEGKQASAKYYARNVLPGVFNKLEIMNAEDNSALEMSDAAFGSFLSRVLSPAACSSACGRDELCASACQPLKGPACQGREPFCAHVFDGAKIGGEWIKFYTIETPCAKSHSIH